MTEFKRQGLNHAQAMYMSQEKYLLVEGIISDKSSALTLLVYALADMFGPLLGGMLNDLFGYINSCDIMTILVLVFLLGYLCVESIRKNNKMKEN